METREIKITAEPQMDPGVCKFYIDRPVFKGLCHCTDPESAKGSPLLEALFALSEVRQVLVAGDVITVSKAGDDGWQETAQKVGGIIREKLAAGGDLIDPDYSKKIPTSDELREKILDVFNEEINPGLAMHGGSVELVDIQGTTIFVTMSGGCQGCASAVYTLRHGIEQILRSRIPEITEIVDVTDHSAGDNPYF